MGFVQIVDSAILFEQFIELQSRYPRLRLTQDEKGLFVVRGELDFSASFEDVYIEDSYSIEIVLPRNYPDISPRIFESNKRIPPNYHMFEDGSLCLGAPVAVRKTFYQTPTLIGFVENNVIPYFYRYSYKCEYGGYPFGELSHGLIGIREFYQEHFNVDKPEIILRLLEILAKNIYRGHHNCPCLSGKKVRDCHGDRLLELQKWQSSLEFANEYICLTRLLNEEKQIQNASMQRVLHQMKTGKIIT